MEKPFIKGIILCICLAVIASIFGFCLGIHKIKKEINNKNNYFINNPIIFDNVKYKKQKLNDIEKIFDNFDNMFENMRKEQYNEMRRFQEYFGENYNIESHLEDLTLTGDFNSKGAFKYYESKNINGENSTLDIDGNWNQGNENGLITINGKNKDGIKFYFSGTIDNGKLKGTITNENGNEKFVNLKNIDINEIKKISDNL